MGGGYEESMNSAGNAPAGSEAQPVEESEYAIMVADFKRLRKALKEAKKSGGDYKQLKKDYKEMKKILDQFEPAEASEE